MFQPCAQIRSVSQRCVTETTYKEIYLPWPKGSESLFTKVLTLNGSVNSRAQFHRPVLWHGVHLGVGKAFLVSAMSVFQKAIPGNNVDVRFERISSHYSEFCKQRRLDPSTFGVGGPMEEPSAGWNKTSLTSTLSKYLEYLISLYREPLNNMNERFTYIDPWFTLFILLSLLSCFSCSLAKFIPSGPFFGQFKCNSTNWLFVACSVLASCSLLLVCCVGFVVGCWQCALGCWLLVACCFLVCEHSVGFL